MDSAIILLILLSKTSFIQGQKTTRIVQVRNLLIHCFSVFLCSFVYAIKYKTGRDGPLIKIVLGPKRRPPNKKTLDKPRPIIAPTRLISRLYKIMCYMALCGQSWVIVYLCPSVIYPPIQFYGEVVV